MATLPCGNTTVTWSAFRPPVMSSSSTNKFVSTDITMRALAFSSSSLFSQHLAPHTLFNSQWCKKPCHRLSRPLIVKAAKDYYSILGVSKNASKSDIKSAYRKLARNYHPDLNKLRQWNIAIKAVYNKTDGVTSFKLATATSGTGGLSIYWEAGAEQKFKEISEAYEVLSDDERRSIYDRYGEDGFQGSSRGMGDFTNPFDLFSSLFDMDIANRGARSMAADGEDLIYNLVLTFKEAIFGAEKEIEVSRLDSCTTCGGSGAKPGTNVTTCTTCGGQGQVVSSARTPLGVFQQVMTCSACSGTGETSTPCNTCSGEGRVRKSKRINLKVPAGVDSGSRLRVRSEGNAGKRGGTPGDLFVVVEVIPDPVLKREDSNILYTCKISYIDAILGTTVTVPTVDGKADLKIPAGVQPGTTLVMAKKGVPLLNKKKMRGDQLVRVQVEIPRRLSDEERKLVEEIANLKKTKTLNGRG